MPYEALVSWAESNPAPEQTSGWYIPSLKELDLIVSGDRDYISENRYSETYDRTNIDTWINNAGGEPLVGNNHWSSTENTWSSQFTCYIVSLGDGNVTQHEKKGWNYVRAVCAF